MKKVLKQRKNLYRARISGAVADRWRGAKALESVSIMNIDLPDISNSSVFRINPAFLSFLQLILIGSGCSEIHRDDLCLAKISHFTKSTICIYNNIINYMTIVLYKEEIKGI